LQHFFLPEVRQTATSLCSTAIMSTSSWNETRAIVATCNLNQWALDFDGNLGRIVESIKEAKRRGARLRVGPELEVCGYSCEDHFLEPDTYIHCEQSLAAILDSDLTDGILCDIGMPVMHNNVRYNCKVFCCNRQIVLIRPKANLANDGNYHEPRFFSSWKHPTVLEEHALSPLLAAANGGKRTVPFGMALIATTDTKIGCEICEELWAPESPHIAMALAGAEIFVNGSGSHHSLRKLDARLALMQNATARCGGVYLYANHRGCDGTRLYFDGSSLVACNGHLLAQASQFSLREVEVVSCVVDLLDVRSHRLAGGSVQEQSSQASSAQGNPRCHFPTVSVPFSLCLDVETTTAMHHYPFSPAQPLAPRLHAPEEECLRGPACWLWDYLRRSGASGFLLPLSGGADSSSVCAIVFTMCLLVVQALDEGDAAVKAETEKTWPGWTGGAASADKDKDEASQHLRAQSLCNHVLCTVYLGTENSSALTRDRSARLAAATGSYHSCLYIDTIITAVLSVFSTLSPAPPKPRFLVHGGSRTEDLALQNIQARLRMVVSYLLAQLLPWVRGRQGWLLVLASANVDESLRGYMTKYDCSSADINPIGGICKADLRRMMEHAAGTYRGMGVLGEIANAAPTAELQPLDGADGGAGGEGGEAGGYAQLDEEDMGMTYAELTVFGRLRKIYRCGPVSMFRALLANGALSAAQGAARVVALSAREIAVKVKRFFFFYAINRHKMTTLTPSYHAESYSPDDNRFDFRPFLYNAAWSRQSKNIDAMVEEEERRESVI